MVKEDPIELEKEKNSEIEADQEICVAVDMPLDYTQSTVYRPVDST